MNISASTYALVRDASVGPKAPAFTFVARGKVQAKGKGELNMYFVASSSTTAQGAATTN